MPTLAELSRRLKRPHRARRLPVLIAMSDPDRLPLTLERISRLPPGAAIVLRHYGVADRRRLALSLTRHCKALRRPLLVAEDARLARLARADGLHLPESLVSRPRRWRLWRRRNWIVTAAAHTPAAIQRASRAGVDAVLVSPVFPTRSHPGAAMLGPVKLARWVRRSPVPVYALGGIDERTARRLTAIPLAGFAAIDAMSPSDRPRPAPAPTSPAEAALSARRKQESRD